MNTATRSKKLLNCMKKLYKCQRKKCSKTLKRAQKLARPYLYKKFDLCPQLKCPKDINSKWPEMKKERNEMLKADDEKLECSKKKCRKEKKECSSY